MENTTQSSDVSKTWGKLSSNLSHSPCDLILHTQRILFSIDNELPKQTCAALQDLFIVLQDNGSDLRFRMFNLASPIIEYSDRRYFQLWLDANNQENQENYRVYDGSLFSNESIKDEC